MDKIHQSVNRHSNAKPIIILIFGVLIILSSLNTSLNSIYKNIGLLSLLIPLITINVGLLVHLLIKKKIPKSYQYIIVFSLILIAWYLIGVVTNSASIRSLIVPVQIMLMINFFIFCSLINWKITYIKKIAIVVSIYIVFSFIWWISSGMTLPFKAYMGNPNVFGAFTFFLLYFPLLSYASEHKKFKKNMWFLILILGIILCYVSMARSLWLCAFASLLTYMLWPHFIGSSRRYTWFYLWTIILVTCATVTYSKLSAFPKIVELNRWVFANTGKSLLSGRDKFWGSLIDSILERPVLGYGGGADLTDIAGITLSAHNLYIQIGLQVGIIGLVVFLLILASVWEMFWNGRNNKTVRISSAFMVGIIIHQMFEVCLTQNNVTVGLIQWLIMAIGVSASRLESNIDIYFKENT